ncbi:MAG TPA: phosphate ABC transporter permease PstA [Gammaproteobacteria bacterium]|nr:phosphate ABC transporter permease PstA [Gammaproteobacteria bacterium]
MKSWFKSGAPWVWLNACAVSVSILMVIGLLALITVRGLGHFWPADLAEFDYVERDGSITHLVGEFHDKEKIPAEQLRASGDLNIGEGAWVTRHLIKTGNRDVSGMDFRWVIASRISALTYPRTLVAIERREWGNLYGYLHSVQEQGRTVAEGEAAWMPFMERLARAQDIYTRIHAIEKGEIGAINSGMERLRLARRGMELEGNADPARVTVIADEEAMLQQRYEALQKALIELYEAVQRDSITVTVSDGRQVQVPLAKIVRAFRPNAMSIPDKVGHYFAKLWEFVSDEPREANTEGGIFPAIFGTVMMVMLMSVFVTPFGVVAAIYLREYARQGWLTRTIRIAVNNLAGVPSIVYGIFGLGFFVYFLGGNIDQLFFPEALPAPTMGTPGILWASLTLALLTVPVVIVATEEGLSRVPRAVREGSLALGATKAETLWRTVLPMASPAIMTGLILAIARAAGEVAPLMLVGVVKLAPALPLDGDFPYLHLDRKFMHLGFHIYDVGFQSPNVEAARPLVYATALLLVLVIVVLNLAAIAIRNRLREKYKSLEH